MTYHQLNKLIRKRFENIRLGAGHTYTAPERRRVKFKRSSIDRKSNWPSVCIYCGKVCGGSNDWTQTADTIETTVEHRTGICIDCSLKRFPQFYTDT